MRTLNKITLMGKVMFLPFISGDLMRNLRSAINDNSKQLSEDTTSARQTLPSCPQDDAIESEYDLSPTDSVLLNWDELSSLANEANGAGAITDAISILKNVGLLMDKMAMMVADLTRSTEDADIIIKATDKIAFQASLLALSAEMKAAQADGDGHEFAIVAHGARKLAMRAADVAKDTNNLIKETLKSFRKETESHSFNLTGKMGLVAEKLASSLEQTTARDILSRALPMVDRATAPQLVDESGENYNSENTPRNRDQHAPFIIDRRLVARDGLNRTEYPRPFSA